MPEPRTLTSGSATESARILVVDHQAEFRRRVAQALRTTGYQCDCVHDAKRATALLDAGHHDLLIADLNMAGNFECELLGRSGHETVGIPVIAVTDNPSVPTAVAALRLGAVDYLVKPGEMDELLAAVERGVTKAQALHGLRRAQRMVGLWGRWFRYLDEILAAPGPVFLPSGVLAGLARKRRPTEEIASIIDAEVAHVLSPREREILIALVAGQRIPDIARSFHISVHTARNHLKSILRKANVHSQRELLGKFQTWVQEV